jgi:DNA-binding beta-propeller fold protein YncE
VSHCSVFRFRFMRRKYSAWTLPLVLLGIGFGQLGSVGAKEAAPIQFVKTFRSDSDVNGNRTPCQHLRDMIDSSGAATDVTGERPAVCDQVLDVIAGKATPLTADLVVPIKAARVAVDSRFRVLITEPTTRTVHILDFASKKFLRIDGAKGDRMYLPYAIAVDANDNIYVTDPARGRIAVYYADGKFKRYIGKFGNESVFESPQSIAIDRGNGRIYLADTGRNFVLILDLEGKILAQVGKRGGGTGPAEFRLPAEVALYENEVFVLDKRNDRVQVLDLAGHFRRQFRLGGSGASEANGMAFDTQGRLFVPALNWVEVFNREGERLFRFGQSGDQPGEFQMANGICTDFQDRLYVMDSGNRRIQVFQVTDRPKSKIEASQ